MIKNVLKMFLKCWEFLNMVGQVTIVAHLVCLNLSVQELGINKVCTVDLAQNE